MRIQSIAPEAAALVRSAPKLAELKKATEDFEAAFAKGMVHEMRQSVGKVHFGQSLGGDTYDDMLDGALAQSLVDKGGLGLAKTLYNRLAPEVVAEARASAMNDRHSSPTTQNP